MPEDSDLLFSVSFCGKWVEDETVKRDTLLDTIVIWLRKAT